MEPEFKVTYDLNISEAIKNKVNRAYLTYVDDCLQELETTLALPVGEYVGALSKNLRNG